MPRSHLREIPCARGTPLKIFNTFRSREMGLLTNESFRAQFSSTFWGLSKMDVARVMGYPHTGCVNTVNWNAEGSLIVAGGDDKKVCIWDAESGSCIDYFHSHHTANIFCAKFLPEQESSIITCAGDGLIKAFHGPNHSETTYRQHQGRVKKLIVEPGNPNLFYSCSEDGTVRFFDLRLGASSPSQGTISLIFVAQEVSLFGGGVNSIAMNDYDPNYFVCGGRHPVVKVFDRRKLPGEQMRSGAVLEFYPESLTPLDHVTGVAFNYNGSEILASYSNGPLYLFHTNGKYHEPSEESVYFPPENRTRGADGYSASTCLRYGTRNALCRFCNRGLKFFSAGIKKLERTNTMNRYPVLYRRLLRFRGLCYVKRGKSYSDYYRALRHFEKVAKLFGSSHIREGDYFRAANAALSISTAEVRRIWERKGKGKEIPACYAKSGDEWEEETRKFQWRRLKRRCKSLSRVLPSLYPLSEGCNFTDLCVTQSENESDDDDFSNPFQQGHGSKDSSMNVDSESGIANRSAREDGNATPRNTNQSQEPSSSRQQRPSRKINRQMREWNRQRRRGRQMKTIIRAFERDLDAVEKNLCCDSPSTPLFVDLGESDEETRRVFDEQVSPSSSDESVSDDDEYFARMVQSTMMENIFGDRRGRTEDSDHSEFGSDEEDTSTLKRFYEYNAPVEDAEFQFTGHRNIMTIKECDFFGPRSEYVMSGSDSGYLFIWEKDDDEPLRVIPVEEEAVNCCKPHPFDPLIAVSGIESCVQLIAPKLFRSRRRNEEVVLPWSDEEESSSELNSPGWYSGVDEFDQGFGSSDSEEEQMW